ncbi:MAG: hypothetical protein J4G03_06605 [Gemmatimonadetes bacterium]|nr:hypothetical protein [Gemmatimonadota bacterium]
MTPLRAPQSSVRQVAEISFKGLRTGHFSWAGNGALKPREYVVVEADRGRDVGTVKRVSNTEDLQCDASCNGSASHRVPTPGQFVLHRAAPADVLGLLQMRAQEGEIRRRIRSLAARHELQLKVSEAEWQWDRGKLTVYFTAERRVDFRGFVRSLARTFNARIELRQIGVRDEARRLGGLGRCRRELCCRSWLPEIRPVTLDLARKQGLPLNAAQISGACGKLMNCLHYEKDLYEQARRQYPKIGKKYQLAGGPEEVRSWNIFEGTVTVRDSEGLERVILLKEFSAERGAARPAGEPRRAPRPAAARSPSPPPRVTTGR